VAEPRREYPDAPRLGVAATVLSRSLPRRVLLVRRGKPPGANTWSLPGGLVDLGEGISDAALREVTEETLLDLDTAGLRLAESRPNGEREDDSASAAFFVTESIWPDDAGSVKYHYLLCHVLCFADDSIDPVASDDAKAACVTTHAIRSQFAVDCDYQVCDYMSFLRDCLWFRGLL
jgi:ADP-ribose pyrophosphatase YjhB (NUDIX family)